MDSLKYYMFGEGKSECPCLAYTLYIITFIGLFKIFRFFCLFISFIYRHTLKGIPNFQKKYGLKDSWAIVTGGSDGIGL